MSSLATVVPTVARTVGTPGAKATATITNATAEIVTAIFLNMTTTRCAASERANCCGRIAAEKNASHRCTKGSPSWEKNKREFPVPLHPLLQ